MKRNQLTYALPLAALLAASTVGQAVAAGDSDRYKSSGSTTSRDSGYGTTQSDKSTSGRSADAGAAVSDAAITAKVKSALLSEPDFPSTQVSVETNNGVVQLSGFLGSQNEIDRAISIARNVEDVKAVENNINMGNGSDMKNRDDMQKRDSSMPQNR